jgi:hypothetical protein
VKRVGYVVYAFRTGAVDVEIVEPPELSTYEREVFPALYA